MKIGIITWNVKGVANSIGPLPLLKAKITYFNIKVCQPFRPAGESKNVTNKSCYICLRG